MASQSIAIHDATGPTMQIKMMGDHYAVLANGYVVGIIDRSMGPGNEGMWGLHFIDGSNSYSYVSLQHAMREAMKWRQP